MDGVVAVKLGMRIPLLYCLLFLFVSLVDKDGNELPEDKRNSLQCVDGLLTRPLDKHHKSSFLLKVTQTSDGDLFRLKFIVEYRLQRMICS
jgi:hypothetical protein